MAGSDWLRWLSDTTKGAPHHIVSHKIGVSGATVGRWVRTGRIPAEGAILIAREYGADPVLALLRTGWLVESDFTEGGLRGAVAASPTHYLTEELHKRAKDAGEALPPL